MAKAASAYLRSARHQPVDWHEWNEEAFAKAEREGKPVLLDIGAVWCHWCHVMDRESYENANIAGLINEQFIAVKVDRDERPDVDTRYQAAVAAISGQGGWPLTAFLTPEGKPYFGGTYFAPEERYGRPSFERVLRSMAAAYRHQRDEVEESAASVMTAVEQNETFSGPEGKLGPVLLDKILESMVSQFDPRHGGFGSQPKFPHPGALDLLIDAALRPGPQAQRCREIVSTTLTRMAAGGIHDQLAGGFHRYSVDERWVVPHFEKMAYDNSELLRVYTHAFQTFLNPEFARTAAGILGWMDEWLSDRERGGFYASQDADESLDDDGDYFTWTRTEAEAVLTAEEFAVAESFYPLQAVGHMHHNPAKNVLHVKGDAESVAARLGRTEDEVLRFFEEARRKLYAARRRRRTPYVDKTVYTGWNGMCISAYLAAGRALALPEATAFALKSLDRVLQVAWQPGRGLLRVVAYGETGEPNRILPAVLDDYAFLGLAALDAWETTGKFRYFEAAKELADALLAHFYDKAGGGFFDTPLPAEGNRRIGILAARRKPLQDAPTPSGNATAATLLLRLHALTNDDTYRSLAEETLQTFAGVAEHLGLYAASYGQALRRLISPPVQVCILGSDEKAEELAAVATAGFQLNKSVIRLTNGQLRRLPAALAETLPHLPDLHEDSVAVVCTGSSCLPPMRTPEALLQALQTEL
ncbi:MAG TPA: thioredoxin domain-containing protein [Acidobacteriaceae bacterium]|nr:thioredoxin domain-containing protein [Acidobacteriaceae bacterium]